MCNAREQSVGITVAILAFVSVCGVADAGMSTEISGLVTCQIGGVLPNTANYEWWYGCNPTAVGMMLGHYDRNGYDGLSYSGLALGGLAEASTYDGTGPYVANDMIASTGHISDFYRSAVTGEVDWSGGIYAYAHSGEDVGPTHTFNCLADFMGTSQDSCFNSNGATWGLFRDNNGRLDIGYVQALAAAYGSIWLDVSGMYGIAEYIDYAAQQSSRSYTTAQLYNQLIDGQQFVSVDDPNPVTGFEYSDYVNEIDHDRPVVLHCYDTLTGVSHSMLGVGYDATGVRFYDTWYGDLQAMSWTGTYDALGYEMSLFGVTALELTGGSLSPLDDPVIVPVPGAGVLGGVGLGLVGWLRRRRVV